LSWLPVPQPKISSQSALETVRFANHRQIPAEQIAKAGAAPQVVEATYGWYWAADVLQDAGAQVHLAHPFGVKGFAYRRVKNDVRDGSDLADLLRMNRLPEWVAPPRMRAARELLRQRRKPVKASTAVKARVHAVLAKCGIAVSVSGLFGVAGSEQLRTVALPAVFRDRVNSQMRLLEAIEAELTRYDN
jgi:transposase